MILRTSVFKRIFRRTMFVGTFRGGGGPGGIPPFAVKDRSGSFIRDRAGNIIVNAPR